MRNRTALVRRQRLGGPLILKIAHFDCRVEKVRVLTTWNRKPPLRSSSWQTIAFLEQSDELTLAEYRSSTTLPTPEKLRDRSMTTHFVPL